MHLINNVCIQYAHRCTHTIIDANTCQSINTGWRKFYLGLNFNFATSLVHNITSEIYMLIYICLLNVMVTLHQYVYSRIQLISISEMSLIQVVDSMHMMLESLLIFMGVY